MNKYELLFIVDASKSDEQKEIIINKVKSMIEKENGTVQNLEKIGVKKYAFPIKFQNEGFYCLLTFEMNTNSVKAVNNQLLITDGIIRHMCIQK